MMLTVDEVPEGYCQISCGRCDCCATVLEVLREQGFAALADAAVAVGLESILSNPGFETTMLAPSDTAMQRAAADLGAATGSPHLVQGSAGPACSCIDVLLVPGRAYIITRCM